MSQNDEFVLEYINHARNNLAVALPELDYFGVRDMYGTFVLIRNAIIGDDWNNYLEGSTALTVQEKITVKLWFKNVAKVREFIGQSSTDTQAKLQSAIRRILNDPDLKAVREKLIAATNHAKELNT